MKFTVAAASLAFIASASAFVPQNGVFARKSALGMSAVDTKTYTFPKSEEIFKEAQDVRGLGEIIKCLQPQSLSHS